MLREILSNHWRYLQEDLFPEMEEELGPLSDKHQALVTVLETVNVESFLPYVHGLTGRPLAERRALARAFIAKAIFNLPTTRLLIDMINGDIRLRRLCGWERQRDIPSEATFSRAFADFALQQLPERMHEALIKATVGHRLAGHVARDSTAIKAREAPVEKSKIDKPERRRGRPCLGEKVPAKDPRQIEQQQTMTLAAMRAALSKACDVGTKRNASGYQSSWIGYKLHIDTIDGDIPVSAILTSASTHDSQVALPLAVMTAGRVQNLYDLMDSAYDDHVIREHSQSLGHIPLIDINPRGNAALKAELARETKARRTINIPAIEDIRYKQRSSAERVNSNLKDNFGASHLRVRGDVKVMAHLMFGVLALAALQIMRLVT